MSFSHEDWLLLILSDGQWHSLAEILHRQPMMAHSRASGLREKGYTIEHKTTGRGAPGSWYRLTGLGSPGSKGTETADVLAAPGDPSPTLNDEGPWQQPCLRGVGGRSESPAVLSDTRPLVSPSSLSGGPLRKESGGMVAGEIPAQSGRDWTSKHETPPDSFLSGGPGAPLVAGANQAGPFTEPPSAHLLQARSLPVILAASPPSGTIDSTGGGSLSGASAPGREGHGHPTDSGCEPARPLAGSPPAQLPLPGIAA